MFGPHEIIEMHEVLASEITIAQKMQLAMQGVQDQELKGFLEKAEAATFARHKGSSGDGRPGGEEAVVSAFAVAGGAASRRCPGVAELDTSALAE